ncbi:hypothetical protein GGTG_03982 [Gaeumannomyces tritici R3-111a-1]|uniref:Uncharacterized protein n=1 Tax=Gaeumannomyces tritici (strain R3-111a-1) TaxID=644352 RepID=J3NRT2_GAET3|nr:hypothetical protein GGTG_03982 [Gaeumannomyces tritici R3-111a-1]EJT78888.1 hypothetical protein GGTG_03982 [Gaeumannomyces tritici R3-111a-1]
MYLRSVALASADGRLRGVQREVSRREARHLSGARRGRAAEVGLWKDHSVSDPFSSPTRHGGRQSMTIPSRHCRHLNKTQTVAAALKHIESLGAHSTIGVMQEPTLAA